MVLTLPNSHAGPAKHLCPKSISSDSLFCQRH